MGQRSHEGWFTACMAKKVSMTMSAPSAMTIRIVATIVKLAPLVVSVCPDHLQLTHCRFMIALGKKRLDLDHIPQIVKGHGKPVRDVSINPEHCIVLISSGRESTAVCVAESAVVMKHKTCRRPRTLTSLASSCTRMVNALCIAWVFVVGYVRETEHRI